MNKMTFPWTAAALIAVGTWTAPVQAAMVFQDDFNSITTTVLNVAPSGWTVISGSGTVDSIKNGGFSLTCFGNTGGCVDLDGSTGNAGIMTNGTYTLSAGTTYTLTAQVSGNQRGAAADSLLFGFRNGSGAIAGGTATVSGIAANAGYSLVQLVFATGANTYTNVSIFFEAAGGDNIGPLLDNVSLTAVPLPAAAWLLLSGLVGFAALGRRKVAA